MIVYVIFFKDETNSDLDDDNDSKKLKDTLNTDENLKSIPATVPVPNESQIAGVK